MRSASELAAELGYLPGIERFYPGRGWGLKYLVTKPGNGGHVAVVKTCSRFIERRLRTSLSEKYVPPARRFALECEVLSSLAELDLGPKVLLCRDKFFVREYIKGRSLAELNTGDIAETLPAVLDAIELACHSGVFHTDLNAGNIIVRPDGRVGFIDCEVPTVNSGEISAEHARLYCHERLLQSLSRLTDEIKTRGQLG